MAQPDTSPFTRALNSFISEMKRKEDRNSPFFKEVLSKIAEESLEKDLASQNTSCEEQLTSFIQDLEQKQRKNSKTLWAADKLRPFMSGLYQYINICDLMIQAAPAAAVVLYGGARLVLQLGQNFVLCFDRILSIMEEIGHLLDCYSLFSEAYQSSVKMQDLLVEAYKTIINFWHRA